MPEPLTHLQARFVDAFIENGGDAANAAREAGYAESTARNACGLILSSPSVRAEVDTRLEALRHAALTKLGAHVEAIIDALLKLGLDESMPPSTRERALRAALDRCGFGPHISVLFGQARASAELDEFLQAVEADKIHPPADWAKDDG